MLQSIQNSVTLNHFVFLSLNCTNTELTTLDNCGLALICLADRQLRFAFILRRCDHLVLLSLYSAHVELLIFEIYIFGSCRLWGAATSCLFYLLQCLLGFRFVSASVLLIQFFQFLTLQFTFVCRLAALSSRWIKPLVWYNASIWVIRYKTSVCASRSSPFYM